MIDNGMIVRIMMFAEFITIDVAIIQGQSRF